MAYRCNKALCAESRLSYMAERSTEGQESKQGVQKTFLGLLHNLNFLGKLCKTALLCFSNGKASRHSGWAFSVSGNFTLSFRFQLKKSLYSTWCPELFRCCVCLKAREQDISIHWLPEEQKSHLKGCVLQHHPTLCVPRQYILICCKISIKTKHQAWF